MLESLLDIINSTDILYLLHLKGQLTQLMTLGRVKNRVYSFSFENSSIHSIANIDVEHRHKMNIDIQNAL